MLPSPQTRLLLDWLGSQSSRITTADFEVQGTLPQDLLDDMFDQGFFSLLIPTSWGGLGVSTHDFCRIVAKVAELDASLAVTLVPHSGMGCKSFVQYGTEEQKRSVLARVREDRGFIAYAQTESEAGSDFSRIRTTIKKTEDGRLRLAGSKIWITNAGWARTIVVVAKCPDHTGDPDGLAFVYLDADDPGLRIHHPYEKMAFQASKTSELYFDDIVLDESRLIGVPGKGLTQFNALVSSGRIGVASGALGLLRRAANLSEPNERLDLSLYLMESLLIWVSPFLDRGSREGTVAASLAKVYCTELAWAWVQELVATAGPEAYGRNDGLAQIYREMPVFRITEGPNEVIGFKCGIDLLMAPFPPLEATLEALGGLDRDHQFLADAWNLAWGPYKDGLTTIVQNARPLSERQVLLDRVVRSTLALCVLASLIHRATALGEDSSPGALARIARGAALTQRDLERWCMTVLDEDQLVSDGMKILSNWSQP